MAIVLTTAIRDSCWETKFPVVASDLNTSTLPENNPIFSQTPRLTTSALKPHSPERKVGTETATTSASFRQSHHVSSCVCERPPICFATTTISVWRVGYHRIRTSRRSTRFQSPSQEPSAQELHDSSIRAASGEHRSDGAKGQGVQAPQIAGRAQETTFITIDLYSFFPSISTTKCRASYGLGFAANLSREVSFRAETTERLHTHYYEGEDLAKHP